MTTETPNSANGAAPARTAANSAGADLDGLLREFSDPQPGAAKPDAIRAALEPLKPVIAFAETEMNTRAKAALDGDIKKAVDFVKEDASAKDIPPKLVRGFLEGYAAENDTFREAFANRAKDPTTWQSQLATARGAFVEEIKGLPGNTVKHDIEAARAAVAGQTPTVGEKTLPSPNEMLAMSDQDFDKIVKQQIAAQR